MEPGREGDFVEGLVELVAEIEGIQARGKPGRREGTVPAAAHAEELRGVVDQGGVVGTVVFLRTRLDVFRSLFWLVSDGNGCK